MTVWDIAHTFQKYLSLRILKKKKNNLKKVSWWNILIKPIIE